MKYLLFCVIFVLAVLSVAVLSRPLLVSAQEANPSTDPPTTIERACPQDNICFGTTSEKFCKKVYEDAQWITEDGKTVCAIPRDEYEFARYLAAWINIYLEKVALAVGLIVIITAGILYMFSGKDPGKATLAKDLIFTTLIGLAAIYLAGIFMGWLVG